MQRAKVDHGLDREQSIVAWDFTRLQARCIRDYGWEPAYAKAAVHAYEQFLVLLAMNPRASYGMAGQVDDVWHAHIIDTRDYAAMCSAVVGGFVHHEVDLRAAGGPDLYPATLAALQRVFGSDISPIWPTDGCASAIAKCCNGHVQPVH